MRRRGCRFSRLNLADYLDTTPNSSKFEQLVASSRLYGLTSGGINASEYGLTTLGDEATGADEVAQAAAFKTAVMNVPPFKAFFDAHSTRKYPSTPSFKEFLVKNADVPEGRAEDCTKHILADAETAGLVKTMKAARYVDLEGVPATMDDEEEGREIEDLADTEREGGEPEPPAPPPPSMRPKKVFIAHGRNHTPLDQLKKALDQFKVDYAVAINEPNAGRPISKKVATLMKDQCSSGIFIFTADEEFQRPGKDGEMEQVWRPSENVVYELGAASILYENRIVIFKEKGVSFPSDFSDLGYIEFEKDQLVAELGNLFQELVALDILEVRAKG
jgi:Predicted nucleotide-binding protein containing TIR-like domain